MFRLKHALIESTTRLARVSCRWRHFDIVSRDVTSTILNSGNVNDVISTILKAARLTGLDKHAVHIIANNSLILSPILIKFLLICSQ
jgi:hypothetical protein